MTWVVNITDVDDKLIKKANERGISMLEVAEENIADYHCNLGGAGRRPDRPFPAGDRVHGRHHRVRRVAGRARLCLRSRDGDVYFDVGKDAEYGKLSNRIVESMQGEGGETAARKRHAGRFRAVEGGQAGRAFVGQPVG